MGKEVPESTHEAKNSRVGGPFADVALMHLGPGIDGGSVNFPWVCDKLVRFARDRDSDTQGGWGSRWLKVLTSLADAEGGTCSKPAGTMLLHM